MKIAIFLFNVLKKNPCVETTRISSSVVTPPHSMVRQLREGHYYLSPGYCDILNGWGRAYLQQI